MARRRYEQALLRFEFDLADAVLLWAEHAGAPGDVLQWIKSRSHGIGSNVVSRLRRHWRFIERAQPQRTV